MAATEESPQDHSAAPALPGPLVDTAWLRDGLNDPRLRTVDLRDVEAYCGAHIPGAVQLDLSRLGSTRNGCDSMLLAPDEFARLMARLGISNREAVVAYDDQWGLAAARLVWALHYYGHPRAAVLDGGWDRWQDGGGPTAEGPSTAKESRFDANPDPDLSADLEWISSRVTSGDVVLLDTRTRAEFDRGHVPGATSWDWFNAVPVGSWACSRDPEELRAEWAELGLLPSHEVAVYCRSGMRAAHTYVVLKHAGFRRVRLYDGSWQEWSVSEGLEGRAGAER